MVIPPPTGSSRANPLVKLINGAVALALTQTTAHARPAPAHEEKTQLLGTGYAAACHGSKAGAGHAASRHSFRARPVSASSRPGRGSGNTPSFILLPLGPHLCII